MAEHGSRWVMDVGDDDFEREVLERSRELPVVVDFWAPWCAPCRMLGPILERLAAEWGGQFLLAKVNTQQATKTAAHFGIDAIPAVIAFRDGQPFLGFTGLLPETQVREFLGRVCPTEADKIAKAASSLETSEPSQAEGEYRRALELDPQHQLSLLGLARLHVARGQEAEAAEYLGRIAPNDEHAAEVDRLTGLIALRRLGSEDGDEDAIRQRLTADQDNADLHYRLGCLLAAAGRYPEALAELLAAAERDKGLAASRVREAMLQIFQMVGVRSELADDYRARLQRLLY